MLSVLSLPAAAIAAEWVPGDEGLLAVAVVAVLTGRWLASRDEWGWSVWLPVGAALGTLTSLSVAAHACLFWPGGAQAALGFVERWLAWVEAAATGGRSQDPDVFLFYVALLCWLACMLSAWALYRRRSPFVALIPPLALAAVSIFFSKEGIPWIVSGLGLGVLLVAVASLRHAELAWDRQDIDYAVDLISGVIAAAVLVSALVVVISYLGPLATPQRISDWFRRTFTEPTEDVEETAERLFGGVKPPEGGIPELGDVSSALPQNRALGGSPNLQGAVIMVAATDEDPPPPEELHHAQMQYLAEPSPPHYWQGLVFDTYTGAGWNASVQAREQVTGVLPIESPYMYREVVQNITLVAPHGETLFSLSRPYSVTQPLEALWRTPPSPEAAVEADLAGLASEVVSYTVVSRLADPWASDLRASRQVYPPEVISYYLQLPPTLPRRVLELGRQVTAPGDTVYDKARLLETYLRQYPYTLELEEPPEGRDVVDYFLFDVREGYCDYYASAFVVLARAVGIPARLVTGYVGGQYDYDLDAYVVRHYDGHSWPEVYFAGWGWIGFEPTGSQPVTRLQEEPTPSPYLQMPQPIGPPARVVRMRWRLSVAGAIGLVAIGILLGLWIRRVARRRAAQVLTLNVVWGRLSQAGARMGHPLRQGMTALEFARGLATELERRAQTTRCLSARWTAVARRVAPHVRTLGALYTAATYGGYSEACVEESILQDMWREIRWPLRWFAWLARVRLGNSGIVPGRSGATAAVPSRSSL